jgi:Fe-Mn family superoxide dismutase
MDARLQPLPFHPASLHRLSSGLIESHHQNNYGGAGCGPGPCRRCAT